MSKNKKPKTKVAQLMTEHGVSFARFSPSKAYKVGSFQAMSFGSAEYFGKVRKKACEQCRKIAVLSGRSDSGHKLNQCLNGCVPVLSKSLGRLFGL